MEPNTERTDVPAFVGVAVPAYDEARSVRRAVAALKRAASHPALRRTHVMIVVVDDSSTDGTGERSAAALGQLGSVLRVDLQSAGGARRAGFSKLCEASRGLSTDDVWLATTDADTVVPPDWLARQMRWRKRGADAIAGTVRPISWHEQPPLVRRRYEANMAKLGCDLGHPHVYGANLGLTKSAYLAAGGIPPLGTGEDHALWEAINRSDILAVQVPDIVVATSTRREGRAPGGFSDLLRSFGNST